MDGLLLSMIRKQNSPQNGELIPVLLGLSRVGRIRLVQAQEYVKYDREVKALGRVIFYVDYIKNLNISTEKLLKGKIPSQV